VTISGDFSEANYYSLHCLVMQKSSNCRSKLHCPLFKLNFNFSISVKPRLCVLWYSLLWMWR